MSKLCQCQVTKMDELIGLVESNGYRTDVQLPKVIAVVEEGCTCQEKKEEYEESSHLEDLHSFVTTNLKDYKGIVRTELPQKQECDHIVGLRNIYHTTHGIQPGLIEVHESDIAGKGSIQYRFKECPECGEKLNLK